MGDQRDEAGIVYPVQRDVSGSPQHCPAGHALICPVTAREEPKKNISVVLTISVLGVYLPKSGIAGPISKHYNYTCVILDVGFVERPGRAKRRTTSLLSAEPLSLAAEQ